jgi:hypothetical protein
MVCRKTSGDAMDSPKSYEVYATMQTPLPALTSPHIKEGRCPLADEWMRSINYALAEFLYANKPRSKFYALTVQGT